MMRYFAFLLLFSNLCLADPFYADSQVSSTTQTENFTDFNENLTPCSPDETVEKIYIPIDFTQVKLVGILHSNEKFKALFIDKDNKLFDMKEKDFIVSSQIQVESIDLKRITLIDWKNSKICQQPHKIQLKL